MLSKLPLLYHRLLLLKLDKQIGGTIYRHILAANEACHMDGVDGVSSWRGWGATLEGVGTVNMPSWMRLCGCVSSFNNRSL